MITRPNDDLMTNVTIHISFRTRAHTHTNKIKSIYETCAKQWQFFAYFPFLKKKMTMLCPSYNFGTNTPMYTKFGMKVMPVEVTPTLNL
jgi:hypothetical protein